MSTDMNCGSGGGASTYLHLRIGSVFIVMIGSTSGAFFPIIARKSSWIRMPAIAFEFAKYFGSGVIIATAFIHLLAPALTELSSPCLNPAWLVYPYPLAFALLSIFCLFIVEFLTMRWGTAKLAKLGIAAPNHHGPVASGAKEKHDVSDEESAHTVLMTDSALAHLVGVAVLEFGVILHSILIGLTLAVDSRFIILFIVIVFHQTFEGLGIGSRLAYLDLPAKYKWVPYMGAALYGITTPLGIAVGLGVRTTYNPGSTTASIVSGVMDSISAGILLYTGLVELIAHEFMFNKEMLAASNAKVTFAIVCMLAGCGIMALLGRWA